MSKLITKGFFKGITHKELEDLRKSTTTVKIKRKIITKKTK